MYLYILRGEKNNKYYIGITTNLDRRIEEHSCNKTHFTGLQHEVWKIVFTKFFDDDTLARREEIRLKKAKNRRYLEWYMGNKGA